MKTVGIIGLGSIGRVHVENLLDMDHQVIGYDPDEAGFVEYINGEAKSAWLGRNGFRFAETVEEFYEAKKDAVVIASPTREHVEHLRAVKYDAGSMPVLVEKPLGGSQQDIFALEYKLLGQVMVGNNLRFHGCVQKAKEWLVERGTPIWANFTVAQYNGRPRYLRDGVTLNWGAHEMDLALYLLGPAEVVGASINREDTVSQILLMHESGCRTVLHFDYLTMREVRTFMIQGQDKLIACNIPLGVTQTNDGDVYSWSEEFDETYVLEMKAFLDGDTSIAATGEDGLRCLKLLLDAKKMGGL